jgi:hypothetical protein
VIRDGDVSQDLTVSYSLAMDPQNTPWGVPLPANAFAGGLTGSVTILAGQEYVDLNLTTVPNANPGRNLAFLLSISAAGFTDPSPISGIIMDDDSGISVALADATGSEVDGITLVFTREGSNLGPTDVAWELISRGKETVQEGDFAADEPLSGLVSFAEGDTEITVTIALLDDNWVEGKENFVVRLLSSSNATQLLRTPEIEGAVTDNDTITQGNDDIAMGSGSSRIEALDGDDYVVGGGGADVIFGGDGNDVLVAGTQDFLTRSDGLSGSAQVYGGNGDDIIVFGSSGLIGAGLPTGLFGGDGFDTVAIDIGIGSNQTFDFSAMAQPAQFDSIEMVQISSSASQSNTLKLSAQAMQWQGIDVVIDADKGLGGGLHQLFIAGQLGDQVQLSDYSDWVLAGPDIALDLSLRYFTEPSYAFNVYTNLSANSQIIVSKAVEVVAGQTQFAPTSALYVPSQIQIALDAQGAWQDLNHNGLRDDGATDLALVQSLDHPGLFTIEGISFVDDNVELRFTSQFDTELDMTGAGEGDTILIDLMAESAAWFDYPTGGVFDILDGAVPQLHAVGDAAPYTQGVTLEVFNPENTDVIQIGLVSDPSDAADQIPYQGLQLASYVADTVEISYVHLQIT